MAEFINASDSLNNGRNKINRSMQQAERAEDKSDKAIKDSGEALTTSQSVQYEFNQVVIDGDSSVESAQARVGADGTTYPVLKERLDREYEKVTAQVDQNAMELSSKSKGVEKNGAVVFISDDGASSNETHLIPMFIEKNVPLCIAIYVRGAEGGRYISYDRFRELQNEYGFEMLSHSITHGLDGTQIPDMSAEDAEWEYTESKKRLKEQGLKVESYAVPGGNYGIRERNFSRKHYRASRTSVSGTNPIPIETHELKTYWLDEQWPTSLEFSFYKDAIDKAVANNELLIISTHGQSVTQQSTVQTFRQVIDYAKSKTDVLTLSDALDKLGNVIEVGDFSKGELTRSLPPSRNFFVMGADGTVIEKTDRPKNEFTVLNDYADFPGGVTKTFIDSTTAEETGSPEGAGGVLYTHKTSSDTYASNYQEYHIFRTNRIYRRYVLGLEEFGEWELLNSLQITKMDNFSPDTPFTDFPVGVTITPVSKASSEATNAPVETSGSLFTYKITELSSIMGFNYQEYHLYGSSRTTYKREVKPDGEFGDWFTHGGQAQVLTHNAYNATTLPRNIPLQSGISISSTSNLEGTPTNKAGTIVSYSVSANVAHGYSWQEFHPVGQPEAFKRTKLSSDEWSEWVKLTP